jgi:hypothetical protein
MSAYTVGLPSVIFMTYVRALFGVGILATLAVGFKPLGMSLLRAALLILRPRHSAEQDTSRNNLRGVLMLNRMATELEITQPNLAAELRLLACRG